MCRGCIVSSIQLIKTNTYNHNIKETKNITFFFFFSSRRRHTRCYRDWSSDVCSSDLFAPPRPRSADEDWYRVAPGPGRTLALRVELAPAHAAELEVLDRDRNRTFKLRTDGEPLLVPAIACAEACFVHASSTEAGPYKLTVVGTEPVEGRELEPNDRAVDATAVSPGKPVEGTYGWAEDEDWYRVEVRDAKPGQFLRVEVTGVAGVRPEMEVRGLQDGALLATVGAQNEGDGVFLRDLGLGLGGASSGGGTSTLPSTSTFPSTSPPTSPSTPTPTATPTAIPTARPTPIPTAIPTATATATGDTPPVPAPAPPPAGYYLVLRSAPVGAGRKAVRGANPRVPYRLTAAVEAGPDDLEQEPNDEPARATEIGR